MVDKSPTMLTGRTDKRTDRRTHGLTVDQTLLYLMCNIRKQKLVPEVNLFYMEEMTVKCIIEVYHL